MNACVPILHEDEAEAGCYEAEVENFGLEATLAWRTQHPWWEYKVRPKHLLK